MEQKYIFFLFFFLQFNIKFYFLSNISTYPNKTLLCIFIIRYLGPPKFKMGYLAETIYSLLSQSPPIANQGSYNHPVLKFQANITS